MILHSWHKKIKSSIRLFNENTTFNFTDYDQEFIKKSDDIECRTNEHLEDLFNMILSYKMRFIEYKSTIKHLESENDKLHEENELLRQQNRCQNFDAM